MKLTNLKRAASLHKEVQALRDALKTAETIKKKEVPVIISESRDVIPHLYTDGEYDMVLYKAMMTSMIQCITDRISDLEAETLTL